MGENTERHLQKAIFLFYTNCKCQFASKALESKLTKQEACLLKFKKFSMTYLVGVYSVALRHH